MRCLQILLLLSYSYMVHCFVCTTTGKFRVNRSCGTYYNCQESGKYPGVLIKTKVSCGLNKIFYTTSKTSGKCDADALCVDFLCQGKSVGSIIRDPNEDTSGILCPKNYYICTYTGIVTPKFNKCNATSCFDPTNPGNPCVKYM